MEALAKETLWGRTLVETVQELVAEGKIHPHLAKNVMYVLQNKANLSFLNDLQINARELVLYRRRGCVLELRLQDVSLDRVFTHVRSGYVSHEMVSKFAQVNNLTLFAFDCRLEEDTDMYLQALSKMLGKDVSELKEHFLPVDPEHVKPAKAVVPAHDRHPIGKHERVSMYQPPVDPVALVIEPTHHATPCKEVSCIRKQQRSKRGRPRKVSTHQPPLNTQGVGIDSVVSPRRPLLSHRPRGRPAKSQENTTDSTTPEEQRDIGRRARRRGRAGGRGNRVISQKNPGNETAHEDGQAEATRKESKVTVRTRRRRGRPPLSRSNTRPQGTPGPVEEIPHVTQTQVEADELTDVTEGVGEAGEDKEPVNSCSSGVMV